MGTNNNQHTKGPVDWFGTMNGTGLGVIKKFPKDSMEHLEAINEGAGFICEIPTKQVGAALAVSGSEAEANAELIVEAFNVATETGLTPRQFKQQRDELLEALSEAVRLFENYGLVAGRIEDEPNAPGKWINQARAAIAKTNNQDT